jgi:hypothetical protein
MRNSCKEIKRFFILKYSDITQRKSDTAVREATYCKMEKLNSGTKHNIK